MGSIPSVTDCRSHLEGYNITTSILSDAWITDERDNSIIPFVETFTGNLSAEEEITEYYSGNGTDSLILNRRNINSITSIQYVNYSGALGAVSINSVVLIAGQGIVKAKANMDEGLYNILFSKGNKNIKVVYKIGGTVADDIEMAIKKLTCCAMLDNLEGRTGGGSLTVQGFGRQYGDKGKYTNIRARLYRQALLALRRYQSSVVGS